MEFIKYIKILGCALFVVSCGSSPKNYERDGSDIPGYSKMNITVQLNFQDLKVLPLIPEII